MPIVLLMSTDPEIVETNLSSGWPQVTALYSWDKVKKQNLNINAGETLVVIAHGNDKEIGNEEAGEVDIDAAGFLLLIHENMKSGGAPAAIYISTCGPGIAQFAADVRLTAQANKIWDGVKIYGHCDKIKGPVPPPNDMRWTEIYSSKLRH